MLKMRPLRAPPMATEPACMFSGLPETTSPATVSVLVEHGAPLNWLAKVAELAPMKLRPTKVRPSTSEFVFRSPRVIRLYCPIQAAASVTALVQAGGATVSNAAAICCDGSVADQSTVASRSAQVGASRSGAMLAAAAVRQRPANSVRAASSATIAALRSTGDGATLAAVIVSLFSRAGFR
jgi:hypothetical protein